MSWTVEQAAKACGGIVQGDARRVLRGVSTDSRTVEPDALFVAIAGERFDGHDFLAEAVQRGAAALLVSRAGAQAAGSPTIQVPDTITALGALAQARRACFNGPVVAITGSNGKTTTKEMCAEILAAAGLTVRRSPGNLNNHIGMPLSILGLQSGDQALVVELGMNHAGEIAQLAQIASPDVGAITQVAPAHLGPLGSLDAIGRAKGELFDHLRASGTAVINADDAQVRAQAARFKGRHLSFGFGSEADFRAEIEQEDAAGSLFSMRMPEGVAQVRLPLPGRHLVADALCAAAAAYASGALGAHALAAIRAGLERFAPLPGRLAVRRGSGNLRLLDDSYNANPRSVEAALRTLMTLASGDRALLVLGDMLELGAHAEELHREVGALAADLGLFALIGVGPLAAHAVEGARAAGIPQAQACGDAAEAAACVRELGTKDACVLVKGSRGTQMERVVSALLGDR